MKNSPNAARPTSREKLAGRQIDADRKVASDSIIPAPRRLSTLPLSAAERAFLREAGQHIAAADFHCRQAERWLDLADRVAGLEVGR